MLWSARVNPAVVLLAPSPDFVAGRVESRLEGVGTMQESAEGTYSTYGPGARASPLLLLPGYHDATSMAAVIPLDADLKGRMEALICFWRTAKGRSAPPDTRVTAQQRLRLRAMMLAADARADGASYRDIAFALYGRGRIASEPWKTSSLRDRVIGLVKDGHALISGGYLKLLHHRRRP